MGCGDSCFLTHVQGHLSLPNVVAIIFQDCLTFKPQILCTSDKELLL